MEALPYYKWFWQKWRASREVQRMGYVARGLYRELLDEQWDKGGIPDDVNRLAAICDCPIDVMQAEWPKVAPSFPIRKKGLLVNGVLESMRTQHDQLRVDKSIAGKMGALAKLNIINANVADASKCQASAKQVPYRREEERREENKALRLTPLSSATTIRPEEYANIWNRNRGNLPKVESFTDSRRKKVKSRINQGITLEQFTEAVIACRTKPFLRGENDRGWTATFDWLITNDRNIERALNEFNGNGAKNGKRSKNSEVFDEIYREWEAANLQEAAGNGNPS